MFCLHECLGIICVPAAWKAQERLWIPCELELQMVLSLHVDIKKSTWLLWRSSHAFNWWAISPVLTMSIFWVYVYKNYDSKNIELMKHEISIMFICYHKNCVYYRKIF